MTTALRQDETTEVRRFSRIGRGRLRHTVSRMAAVTAAASVLGMLAALPASAHETLVATDPAETRTIDSMPRRVALTFNDAVAPYAAVVVITDPNGEQIQSGEARIDGAVVKQELGPATTDGNYTVAYRIVSADGHPVSGKYAFTYKARTPTSSGTESSSANPRAPATPASSSDGPSNAAIGASDTSGVGESMVLLVGAVSIAALVSLVMLVVAARRRSGQSSRAK